MEAMGHMFMLRSSDNLLKYESTLTDYVSQPSVPMLLLKRLVLRKKQCSKMAREV